MDLFESLQDRLLGYDRQKEDAQEEQLEHTESARRDKIFEQGDIREISEGR